MFRPRKRLHFDVDSDEANEDSDNIMPKRRRLRSPTPHPMFSRKRGRDDDDDGEEHDADSERESVDVFGPTEDNNGRKKSKSNGKMKQTAESTPCGDGDGDAESDGRRKKKAKLNPTDFQLGAPLEGITPRSVRRPNPFANVAGPSHGPHRLLPPTPPTMSPFRVPMRRTRRGQGLEITDPYALVIDGPIGSVDDFHRLQGTTVTGPGLVPRHNNENEQRENEQRENEQRENERQERERLENERLESERLENERLENERLENERIENEELENEETEVEESLSFVHDVGGSPRSSVGSTSPDFAANTINSTPFTYRIPLERGNLEEASNSLQLLLLPLPANTVANVDADAGTDAGTNTDVNANANVNAEAGAYPYIQAIDEGDPAADLFTNPEFDVSESESESSSDSDSDYSDAFVRSIAGPSERRRVDHNEVIHTRPARPIRRTFERIRRTANGGVEIYIPE
jgi:hypothetical protein